MKKVLNNFCHAVGYMLMFVGFLACIETAKISDLGVELSQVIRYGVCGISMMGTGLFLTWWRV